MGSKKSKIVSSLTASRLEFFSLTIANQFQPIFYKPPRLEQRVIKLDWQSIIEN